VLVFHARGTALLNFRKPYRSKASRRMHWGDDYASLVNSRLYAIMRVLILSNLTTQLGLVTFNAMQSTFPAIEFVQGAIDTYPSNSQRICAHLSPAAFLISAFGNTSLRGAPTSDSGPSADMSGDAARRTDCGKCGKAAKPVGSPAIIKKSFRREPIPPSPLLLWDGWGFHLPSPL
jgi:hypothetical protein